jgi:hypothetical protein
MTWRTGRKFGRTLYRNEVCAGMVDTPEIAAEIVEAINRLREAEYIADGVDAERIIHNESESRLAAANALLDLIRHEVESVNGKYVHPDQLEQAVCGAFDRIRAHLASQPATALTVSGRESLYRSGIILGAGAEKASSGGTPPVSAGE